MEIIKNFINEDGIVKSWPSKRSKKLAVLEYLATKFEKDKTYTEKDINNILNEWHAFNDAPLLRRELYDLKYLDREKDCSKYWVIENKGEKMDNIKIVEYDETYAEAVAEMWNNSKSGWLGTMSKKTKESVLQRERLSAYLNLYLAIIDDKVAGYCKLGTYHNEANTLYIDGLGVSDEFQGKKVGKALMIKSVERTVELGYPRLDLYTWEGNKKAIPLYKKCGFFWEDNDYVHLMNFVPELISSELLGDYFKKAYWYEDNTRKIETVIDSKKINEFEVFKYEWEHEGHKLIVEYTRRGRGIKSIETNDYIIDTKIESAKLLFGNSYDIVYEVTNKTGKRLDVEINGVNDKNIEYDLNVKVPVAEKEIVKGQFFVKSTDAKYSSWVTHPSVISKIKVNGKSIVMKTGISADFPLTFNVSKDLKVEEFKNRESVFFLNMENNYSGKVNYKFKLTSSENINILDPEVDVTLDHKERASRKIRYIAKDAELFIDEVSIKAVPESGSEFVFENKITESIHTENGTFIGSTSRHYLGGNGSTGFYFSKEENMMKFSDTTNIYSFIFCRAPFIGKPYTQEFETKKPYKVEHSTTDSVLKASFFYRSDDFKGIEIVDNISLYPNKTIERYYQVTNNGTESKDICIKDHYTYDWIGDQFLHYNGKVLKNISHHLKEENITENWLLSGTNAANSFVSFCWGKNAKPMFKDEGIYFDVEIGQLKPGETKNSEPVTSHVNRFKTYQELRKHALIKYGFEYRSAVKEEDYFEMEVNKGNPFSEKLNSGVKNSSDRPLEGTFLLHLENEKVSELVISEEENVSNKNFDIDLDLKDTVNIVEAEFSLTSKEFKRAKVLFRKSSGNIKTEVTEIEGKQVLQASNGLINIKSSSDFAPVIHSLQCNGQEYLDSSFPQPKAKAWWNPWFGGISTLPQSLLTNKKLLEEKNTCEFVRISDNFKNIWEGIKISTMINKNKDFKGISSSQYYLMLPGVPVVASFTIINNRSNKHMSYIFTQSLCFMLSEIGSRTTVNNDRSQNVSLKAESGSHLEFEGSAVTELVNRNEKLMLFNSNPSNCNVTNATHGAYSTEMRAFNSLRNDESLLIDPVFYILSEKNIDENWLDDLKNIKFEI